MQAPDRRPERFGYIDRREEFGGDLGPVDLLKALDPARRGVHLTALDSGDDVGGKTKLAGDFPERLLLQESPKAYFSRKLCSHVYLDTTRGYFANGLK